MHKKFWTYVISIAVALAVGGLSALITGPAMEKFANLNQPPLSPPGTVFPIVWTVLFILMGISAAMIYLSGSKDTKRALTVYAVQLVVNFFWSVFFFSFGLYLFSFIWIVLLWILIIVMIYEFLKIKPIAGYLQIPYLLWVTFAGYLNYMIYYLNG